MYIIFLFIISLRCSIEHTTISGGRLLVRTAQNVALHVQDSVVQSSIGVEVLCKHPLFYGGYTLVLVQRHFQSTCCQVFKEITQDINQHTRNCENIKPPLLHLLSFRSSLYNSQNYLTRGQPSYCNLAQLYIILPHAACKIAHFKLLEFYSH